LISRKRFEHRILSKRKGEKGRWNIVLSVTPSFPSQPPLSSGLPLEEVTDLREKTEDDSTGAKGERGIEMIHDLPKWLIFRLAFKGRS